MDYRFIDLYRPISHYLSDLFWIVHDLSGIFSLHRINGVAWEEDPEEWDRLSTEFDRKLEKMIVRRTDIAILMQKEFLGKIAEYIISDWINIIGIRNKSNFRKYSPKEEKAYIEKNASIYFSCIDGAFWEVYSREKEILDRLRNEFCVFEELELRNRDR